MSQENTGLSQEIKLNGILISQENKFVLDRSFRVPTVPHDREVGLSYVEDRVSFTYIPAGPWEFNGVTLFPGFNSSSIACADSKLMPQWEDCSRYNQLKGPFIHIDCKSLYPPKSSVTYRDRWLLIKNEEIRAEQKEDEVGQEEAITTKYTPGEIVVGTVGVGLLGAWALLRAPGVIAQSGLNKLGVCADPSRWVWFDHDDFFDTVKETIIKDYGSINAYIEDIRQASMAYDILASIDWSKRKEIEGFIHEWETSVKKLLPENSKMGSYKIEYSPYDLVKIPRKADWSVKPAPIEIDLLNHYAEQLSSVNRQKDSYNKQLKHKYGTHTKISP